MCGLCCAVIEAQIIAEGGLKPLMAEDFLDVPDRTAIKEKLSGGGMAKQMSVTRFSIPASRLCLANGLQMSVRFRLRSVCGCEQSHFTDPIVASRVICFFGTVIVSSTASGKNERISVESSSLRLSLPANRPTSIHTSGSRLSRSVSNKRTPPKVSTTQPWHFIASLRVSRSPRPSLRAGLKNSEAAQKSITSEFNADNAPQNTAFNESLLITC